MERTHVYRLVTALLTAGVIWAVLYLVPPAEGLGGKVRLAFFHIPVAWVSVLAFLLSAVWSLQYLRTRRMVYDWRSAAAASLGFVFCSLATASGAVFAKLTWGAYWNWDPRQMTIFVLLLIYAAYLTLRTGIEESELRAKISAVYSLLAFATVPFLVFIIPRYYYSLHPAPVINSAGRIDMDAVMVYVLLAAVAVCTAIFWQALAWLVEGKRRGEQAGVEEEWGL